MNFFKYIQTRGGRTILAALTLVSTTARAVSPLLNERGQIRDEYTLRCPNAMGLSVDSCAQNRVLARGDGCLSASDFDVATRLGLMVMCRREAPSRIMLACPCSCFRPDTRLLVQDAAGEFSWSRIDGVKAGDPVMSLASDVKLPDITLRARAVSYTTHGPEASDLYTITVKDRQRSISVTQHHGLLLDDGSMTTAAELRVGDRLVHADGSPAPVTAITRESASADVVNLLVDSDSLPGHLIVAEDLVVGDLLWQNMLDRDRAAVSLR